MNCWILITYSLQTESSTYEAIVCEVFSSHIKAHDYLAEWCIDRWNEQCHDTEISLKTDVAIKCYFDFWNPEETYTIDQKTMDAKS